MRTGFGLGFFAIGLALGGCATIISGSDQTLTVNSNVEGAEVFLNNQPLGRTPMAVKIKRGQEGMLSVQKPGYQPYRIALNKKINGVFWVNILLGGTFGSSTDYSTGAMYEYEPDTYFASLTPAGSQSPGAREKWQRREALRAFILLNSDALVAELAAGKGEYVDVLYRVLQVKADQRRAAIRRWRDRYAASDTAVEFAAGMVAELRLL